MGINRRPRLLAVRTALCQRINRTASLRAKEKIPMRPSVFRKSGCAEAYGLRSLRRAGRLVISAGLSVVHGQNNEQDTRFYGDFRKVRPEFIADADRVVLREHSVCKRVFNAAQGDAGAGFRIGEYGQFSARHACDGACGVFDEKCGRVAVQQRGVRALAVRIGQRLYAGDGMSNLPPIPLQGVQQALVDG